MRMIRDILILIIFGLPVLLIALINSFLLVIADISGLHTLWNRIQIRVRFRVPRSARSGAASSDEALEKRISSVVEAFGKTGFSTDPKDCLTVKIDGRFGLRVTHKSAVEGASGKKKYALYVEGSDFEMGRFIGMLASPELEEMATTFVDNVIFSFMGVKKRHSFFGQIIADFLYRLSRWMDHGVPNNFTAEMFGLWAGSRKPQLPDIGPRKVRIRNIFTLNYGVDIILSFVYAGASAILRFLGIRLSDFNIQMYCNAFSAFGEAAGGGCYFGRDFMFPTVDIYNTTATHIIYNHFPTDDGEQERILSLNAPGMAGSVLAVNEHRQAMGTDMVNGRNTRWWNLGVNSLLMVRWAMKGTRNADEVTEKVARTSRGVSWLYPFADGATDRAGVIEAGMNRRRLNPLRYVPKKLKRAGLLPGHEFIREHRSIE